MGPYRSATIGYSRRELIADAILHINSITIGCIGLAVLAWRIANDDRLKPLAPGLYLYSVSLVTMFCCSALFNMRVGFVRHSPEKVRFIQLCDHSGIILLIAGTYTPFMLLYCCPLEHDLGFVAISTAMWCLLVGSKSAHARRPPLAG